MNDNPQSNPPDPTQALRQALLHTQPEARTAFQHELEDRLAAQIKRKAAPAAPAPSQERTVIMSWTTTPEIPTHLNGHIIPAPFEDESTLESEMPSVEVLTDVRHFRRFTLPLTLVAALVIAVIVFPTLLSMRDKNAPSAAFGVNAQGTTEAISATTPIVVAAKHLTRGEVIEVGDVVIRDWSSEHVPVDAIRELDFVYGQFVRADIYNGQPILSTHITKDLSAFPATPPILSPTPVPTVEIVVAARHISRGQQISMDDLKVATWDERYVPINALVNTDVSIIVGQFARTDIFRESPLLTTVLSADGADNAQVFDSFPADAMADLVVAVQPIQAGAVITEDMVTMRLYPRFAMPPGTFADPEEVIGHRALIDMYREMPIIDTQLGVAYRTYTLQEGDALLVVSAKYDVSLETILELNNLDISTPLEIGDILILPPETPESQVAVLTATPAPTAITETVNMAPIAIPLNRLTNEIGSSGDTMHIVGFDPGSDVAIIHNRPDTRMTVVVPSARLISTELQVFAEGYASFMVSSEESEALNAILSSSEDLFTLYPIPETQPESAPVVVIVTATPAPTSAPEDSGILLPPGTRMVALPFDRLDSVAYAIQKGDYIDILYTRPGSDEPIIVVEAALVVHTGPIPADDSINGSDTIVVTPDASQDIIAIAVSPATAVALQNMFNESLTFVLRPAGQAAEAKTQQTFALPLDLITNAEILPQVFEFVDVYATLWYVDVDGEFQRVVPETEGATRMTQAVVRNAQVTAVDEDSLTITLLVSDEEAATLSWVVTGRAPITLVNSGANPDRVFGIRVTPTPVAPTPTLQPEAQIKIVSVTTTPMDAAEALSQQISGKQAVAVPLDSAFNPPIFPSIGDRVDVFVTLLFVNVDGETQQIVTLTPPESRVEGARLIHQKSVADAVVLGYLGNNHEVINLLVDPQDALTLTYLVESKTPLTVVPHALGEMASDMVSVESGTFEMGTTLTEVAAAVRLCDEQGGTCLAESGNDSLPVHEVTVDDFVIDHAEVSNAQYINFLNWLERKPDNGCDIGGVLYPCITATDDPTAPIGFDGDAYHLNDGAKPYWPVTHVTWYGANAYCRALGRRLPTEAEWERAARGPENFIYPWGNDWEYTFANTRRAAVTLTAPTFVTAYPDVFSSFGAVNMAGNAAEWVADWYQDRYYDESDGAVNPTGPEVGIEKVVRGGSWSDMPFYARAVHRQSDDPETGSERIGFRCAVGLSN